MKDILKKLAQIENKKNLTESFEDEMSSSDANRSNLDFDDDEDYFDPNNPTHFDIDDETGEVDEAANDQSRPYGVRYKVFAGREKRITAREKWFKTEEAMQKAIEAIEQLGNFYEFDGFSFPQESQVNELSNNTLGNYIDGAVDDIESSATDSEYSGTDHGSRINKRKQGIKTAVKKLSTPKSVTEGATKECPHCDGEGSVLASHLDTPCEICDGTGQVEDKGGAPFDFDSWKKSGKKPNKKSHLLIKTDEATINELSPKTMKSYVKKALDPRSEKSISNVASRSGYEFAKHGDEDFSAGEKGDMKAYQRSKGVQRAVNKLTNESAGPKDAPGYGKKVTDKTVVAVKPLAIKFFNRKPYSSVRIANGTVYRMSFNADELMPGKQYRYMLFSQLTAEDMKAMADIKDRFLSLVKQSGIDSSKVDVKFHIGANMYASVRIALPTPSSVTTEGMGQLSANAKQPSITQYTNFNEWKEQAEQTGLDIHNTPNHYVAFGADGAIAGQYINDKNAGYISESFLNEPDDDVVNDVKSGIKDMINNNVSAYLDDHEVDEYQEMSAAGQLKFILQNSVFGMNNLKLTRMRDGSEAGISFTFNVGKLAYSGSWFPDAGIYSCIQTTAFNKGVTESAEQKFGVYLQGGSIGDKKDKPTKTFDSKEEAQADAKRRNKQLTPGEKSYYKMKYVVKPIKDKVSEGAIGDAIAGVKTFAKHQVNKHKALNRGWGEFGKVMGHSIQARSEQDPQKKSQHEKQATQSARNANRYRDFADGGKGFASTKHTTREKGQQSKKVSEDRVSDIHGIVTGQKGHKGQTLSDKLIDMLIFDTSAPKNAEYIVKYLKKLGLSNNQIGQVRDIANQAGKTALDHIARTENIPAKYLSDDLKSNFIVYAPYLNAGETAINKWRELTNKLMLPKLKAQLGNGMYAESKGTNMKKKISESISPSLDKVLKHFGKEVADFKAGGDLADDLYNALYDYYFDEMPYGTKKARTGDPFEWVADRLEQELNPTYGNMSAPRGDAALANYGDDPMGEWHGKNESIEPIDEDDEQDPIEALDGCEYVQDLANGSEVFRMIGDPYERRVQIEDKQGRGWNIMPSRLTPVYDEELIARWFPDENSMDEGAAGDIMPMEGSFNDDGSYNTSDDDAVEFDEFDEATDLDAGTDQMCVYCGKEVPPGEEPSMFRCCGEVGHTEGIPNDELDEALTPAQQAKMAELRKRNAASPTNIGKNAMGSQPAMDPTVFDKRDKSDRYADQAWRHSAGAVGMGESLDEAFLVEENEEEITAALEEVGLDHGLDFFFDGGLVAIGKSTARVIINALKANPGIHGTPSITSIDGEEVQIGFNQAPKGPTTDVKLDDIPAADFNPDAANSFDMRESKVNEDVTLNISAQGEDDVLNVIRKLSGLGNTEVAAEPTVAAVSTVPSMAELISSMDSPEMEESEGDYANQPDPEVHTSTTDMINRGEDLNRSKRQDYPMRNLGNNPMAEARDLLKQYDAYKGKN